MPSVRKEYNNVVLVGPFKSNCTLALTIDIRTDGGNHFANGLRHSPFYHL